ncbi:MAG: hypothetical protein WD039_09900 [Xanthobacteraceae bacterium]
MRPGTRRLAAAAALLFALWLPQQAAAQFGSPSLFNPPVPPAPIPSAPDSGAPAGPAISLAPPDGGVAAPDAAPQAPAPPAAAPTSPIAVGEMPLALSARFGSGSPAITGGLHWRIYANKPDANGVFELVKEDKSASPTLLLPAGEYVVHVAFGLAHAVKPVQMRTEPVHEIFEIPAGGLRVEGRVGYTSIPTSQISFDVFNGSQFEPTDRRPAAQSFLSGDVVLLPEGIYHIVSKYGDANAVMRSDIRVQAGKLTDITVNHRAAIITLKLVQAAGAEALANTAWSVMTPAGDVVKESIGAFPRYILAEGEYRAIARNEGKVYERGFQVNAGVDKEIEVLAR